MKPSMLVLAIAILVIGCVPKSEAEQLKKENIRLQSEIYRLQSELAKSSARLSTANTELSRKPPIPIRIGFRRALMGPGLVAIFTTTVKQDFPVIVTFRSNSLGTSKAFNVNMNQSRPSELGHSEGATIYPGDEITVENNQFESIKVVCPQQ